MLKLLVSALFLVIFTARGSHYSIVNTTVGGMLKSKRIQNDDTGEVLCICSSMPVYISLNSCAGEYVEMIVDFGGRVEDLVLKSRSTGDKRKVLLTHNDNATAVLENKWWKGMLLLPWANRIAYVRSAFSRRLLQIFIAMISASLQPPLVIVILLLCLYCIMSISYVGKI